VNPADLRPPPDTGLRGASLGIDRHIPKVKEHSMTTAVTRPGPNGRVARPSLGDQLDRLDGILNGLSDALNQSVTAAVSAAVGNAVREAVETATRELAARSAPQAAVITDPGVTVVGRPRRLLRAKVRAAVGPTLASSARAIGRLFPWLGAPLVALARRTARAPGRFAAFALAGVVAGAASGVCGPAMGAALGSLFGAAAAISATSEK
jgi:hypothetical protein